jgi:hypothetical protein
VTVSFGIGTGIVSAWPGTSNASASTTGVAVLNPIVLHLGELQVTGSGGSLFCAQGTTPGSCGTGFGLTTANAYGLGVGNARVDGTEAIILSLVNPNFNVKLIDFTLTGFSGSEQVTYTINGTPTTVSAPATNVAADVFSVNGGLGTAFTNSVTFSVPAGNGGNFSLARLTLDVTAPEPATLGLCGAAFLALGLIRRRIRN